MAVHTGKSKTDQELDATMAPGEHASKVFVEYDNEQNTAFVRSLLQQMCNGGKESDPEKEDNEARRSMHSALQLGDNMWGITDDQWTVEATQFVTVGSKSQAEPKAENNRAAKADGKKRKTKAQIQMYQELSPTKEKAWFPKLLDPSKTKEVPTGAIPARDSAQLSV